MSAARNATNVSLKQLPAGSPVKLITIGEPTGYRPLAEPVVVEPLEDDAQREVVTQTQPGSDRSTSGSWSTPPQPTFA
jgi:hypothetical protein